MQIAEFDLLSWKCHGIVVGVVVSVFDKRISLKRLETSSLLIVSNKKFNLPVDGSRDSITCLDDTPRCWTHSSVDSWRFRLVKANETQFNQKDSSDDLFFLVFARTKAQTMMMSTGKNVMKDVAIAITTGRTLSFVFAFRRRWTTPSSPAFHPSPIATFLTVRTDSSPAFNCFQIGWWWEGHELMKFALKVRFDVDEVWTA